MPVDELGFEVPTRVPFGCADVVKVHDVRVMDAHEAPGIEPLFQAAQREVQRVLANPHWEGQLTQEDLRALTPLIWEHVNPYGTYQLDLDTRLALH